MKKLLSLSALVLVTTLTGCAVNLPYNNRLNYTSISELSNLPKVQDTVYIKWNPDTFPQRIDIQGSDGFVGGGTRTRIPTGVALSSRIEEAIAQIAKLSSNGSPLTITVEKARSGFEYTAGILNRAPAIDVADVTLVATFEYKGQKWTNTFNSKLKDPKMGGSSQTGLLDKAWDDIAVQVAKDVSKHLGNN
ncbi:hypothetical protein WBV44_04750 [Acinetobacter baumannii]|uniref:hypothetical protein n=1 Tax=Acinetobacter baumannii TaxID=470 RepID=UPI000DE6DD74|nr:hypothetical protein [Acinetobacter baumannii]MDC5555752.1 hypothetical protein [Acinetobacter baumannii]SSM81493.1 Uncharacterised protein [Acinetobacter baumannii]SSM82465.1 Uncharacterised protein [Acinetobacter baumannii]SSM91426.1 Uncharacterised protein [Acinetobacter baumannii]SSO26063.1 Uncharacterised protein [Acinetobacter baumannii]